MNFIRDIIKSLKRDYGSEGTVYSLLSNDADLKTGVKRSTFKFQVVSKIIFFPTSSERYSTFDPNHHYGTYDPDTRLVGIDYDDIFEIKVGDYIICDGKTYFIKTVRDYASVAYSLIIKSADVDTIEFGVISDSLTFTGVATYVKS